MGLKWQNKASKLINQNEAKVNGYGLVSMMACLHKWEEIDSPLVLIMTNYVKMCDQNISWWKRVYMKACLITTSKWRYVNENKCKVKGAKPKWK